MWNDFMQMSAPAAFVFVGAFGSLAVMVGFITVNRTVRQKQNLNQQIELPLLKNSNHRVVVCLRQLADEYHVEGYAGVYIPIPYPELARRVALPADEVLDILQRLALARLVVHASEAGLDPSQPMPLDKLLSAREKMRSSGGGPFGGGGGPGSAAGARGPCDRSAPRCRPGRSAFRPAKSA